MPRGNYTKIVGKRDRRQDFMRAVLSVSASSQEKGTRQRQFSLGAGGPLRPAGMIHRNACLHHCLQELEKSPSRASSLCPRGYYRDNIIVLEFEVLLDLGPFPMPCNLTLRQPQSRRILISMGQKVHICYWKEINFSGRIPKSPIGHADRPSLWRILRCIS